jgi:hypothetical protein
LLFKEFTHTKGTKSTKGRKEKREKRKELALVLLAPWLDN